MDSSKRGLVAALMVAMFLGAVEGTIVTTAMPTIIKDLNGFEIISWTFSLYLLTSAVSTPVYGKLSDLYGRKNILSIGILIFIAGSSLCGLSQNMYQLIAFRAIQGFGAGSIFTITYTIVGDVFEIEQRAKIQGIISTVWGVASLAGPFLGGFLIDSLSWHWIFFINVPFGILSVIMLQKNFAEKFVKSKHKIDFLGIIVLMGAIILLLYGSLAGGEGSKWLSPLVIFLVLASLILFVAFYFVERKAKEPIVPFDIFTKSSITVNAISFLSCVILIGADVYMPLYIQNVLGYGAKISGLAMAPMSLSWLLSSFIISKAILRYGEKFVIIISSAIIIVSTALLLTLQSSSSITYIIIFSLIMGFGFGGSFTTLTIMVQESVGYDKRGAAMASNSLIRTMGQTIGISILGSLFNINIVNFFNNKGIKGIVPNDLYSSKMSETGISSEQVIQSLYSSLHIIFIILTLVAVMCLALSLILKSKLKKQES